MTPPEDDHLATSQSADSSDPADGGYLPMGQQIADQMREAILSGELPPGERIRQEALAQRFGVSRIPVREALRLLETEGLVTLVPHSGARVAELDLKEHVELYLIRESLEPVAIAASAVRLTDVDLDAVRAHARRLEAAEAGSREWLDADRQFHLSTYAAADLPRLLGLIEGFWNATQQYRRLFVSTSGADVMRVVHAEHLLILDALERRDPDDAAQHVRSHIRRTRLTLSARGHLFA